MQRGEVKTLAASLNSARERPAESPIDANADGALSSTGFGVCATPADIAVTANPSEIRPASAARIRRGPPGMSLQLRRRPGIRPRARLSRGRLRAAESWRASPQRDDLDTPSYVLLSRTAFASSEVR